MSTLKRRHIFTKLAAGIAGFLGVRALKARAAEFNPQTQSYEVVYCLRSTLDGWEERFRWDSQKGEWILEHRRKSSPILVNLGGGWLPPQ